MKDRKGLIVSICDHFVVLPGAFIWTTANKSEMDGTD